MLILKLCQLSSSDYIPKPERSRCICPKNKEGTGIWDLLGFYKPKQKRITICDGDIQKTVQKLKIKNIEEDERTLVLREIVRLHEHAHAFLHTARIKGIRTKKEWYHNLPKEVNEPLTEFIVRSMIESPNRENSFVEIFDKLDQNTPDYYRKWEEISSIIGPSRHVVVPLVKFARRRSWDSWRDFYTHLGRNIERDIERSEISISTEAMKNLLRESTSPISHNVNFRS